MLISILKSIFIVILISFFITDEATASSTFYKYQGNPILDIDSQSWDNKYLAHPYVLYDNNLMMWYSGHNGNFWSTGLSLSDDPFNWTKVINPVLSSVNTTYPKNLFTPTVIKNNNKYKLWFTDTPDDRSNFHIGYAESIDGINYTILSLNIFNTFNISDYGALAAVSPNVIFNNSKYLMFFNSPDSGNWTIGLAESDDGISWTPYANNPVLSGDAPWDGQQVGGPAVIYDEGVYHMWYSTNTNVPSRINYAYSTDGINWVKPADKNPVIDTDMPGTWEGSGIGDPAVVKLGDRILLWYGAGGTLNGVDAARIGLASNIPFTTPIVFPTATPTVTPIPTITPTATPTSTPTPTPTPLPVSKVVIVPGMGGSYNADAIVNCKPENYAGDWKGWYLSDQVYYPLAQALSNAGFQSHIFYYDWRQDPRDTATLLRNFITQITQTNEQIFLIGHSLGGLVSRSLIEQNFLPGKIKNFVSVGAPNHGAVDTYYAWSGDKVNGDLKWLVGGTLLKVTCQVKHNTKSAILRTYMPSLSVLLPTYDYLRDKKTDEIIPVSTLKAQNIWLTNNDGTFNPYGVMINIVTGSQHQTNSEIIISKASPQDITLGHWLDGKPETKPVSTLDGDGTVMMSSAMISGVDNTQLNLDHAGLISSYTGISEIFNVLGIHQKPVFTSNMNGNEDNLLVVAADTDIISIQKPDNYTVDVNNGIAVINKPDNGNYKIKLGHSIDGKQIYFLRIKSGKTSWKKLNIRPLLNNTADVYIGTDDSESSELEL